MQAIPAPKGYSRYFGIKDKNIEERSMSPMMNSQKIPQEFYENYSRIASHDANTGQLQNQGNTTGNMKLINTLKNSTISAKQNQKIVHSLGTLGLHMPPTNLISEYENIEEMHGVLVAFYQVSHGMLDKVEITENKDNKNNDNGEKNKDDKEDIRDKDEDNLLTL